MTSIRQQSGGVSQHPIHPFGQHKRHIKRHRQGKCLAVVLRHRVVVMVVRMTVRACVIMIVVVMVVGHAAKDVFSRLSAAP